MTIASLGTIAATANSKTFSTVTTALSSGDFAIFHYSSSNVSTTTGTSNDHLTLSGGTGNWTKLAEYTYSPGGVAADGATDSLWLFEATGSVPVGTSMTATFSTGASQFYVVGWAFTKAAGTSIQQSATAVGTGLTGANFGSASFSGLASLGRLYFRGLAKQLNTTTALTPTTNFTATGRGRSGNVSSAVTNWGEFRINTSTGETSNPTFATSAPTVGLFVALEEYTPAGTSTVGTAAGSGAASGSAVTVAPSSGAASASGASSGVSTSFDQASGAAAGVGGAGATGVQIASMSGSAFGSGGALGAGAAVDQAAGSAAALGSASASGVTVASMSGSTAGLGSATAATGASASSTIGTASASGAASATAVKIAATSGSTTGSGAASGSATAIAPASASGASSGTASGSGVQICPTSGSSASTGVSAASASPITISSTGGASTGSGGANGTGVTVVPTSGIAMGQSSASAEYRNPYNFAPRHLSASAARRRTVIASARVRRVQSAARMRVVSAGS